MCLSYSKCFILLLYFIFNSFKQSNFRWSTFNCKIFSFSILRPKPLNLVTTIPQSHHCTTCGKKTFITPWSLTWNLKIISWKEGICFVGNHHFQVPFFGGVTFRNPSGPGWHGQRHFCPSDHNRVSLHPHPIHCLVDENHLNMFTKYPTFHVTFFFLYALPPPLKEKKREAWTFGF